MRYRRQISMKEMVLTRKMARNFELTEGCFGNYLIDEQGVIVAKNVTPEEFEQIIREKI